LSKFLRGPAQVYNASVTGNNTIASFIVDANGASTLVVLNAADTPLKALTVQLPATSTTRKFYRYTVTEAAPPLNPAGDLPAPTDTSVTASGSGLLTDGALPARSINVYVSAPSDAAVALQPPTTCAHHASNGLQWEQSEASYYRILCGGQHLWSTLEATLELDEQYAAGELSVQSVDRYGIASAAQPCEQQQV
jgi:hypothetical protein